MGCLIPLSANDMSYISLHVIFFQLYRGIYVCVSYVVVYLFRPSVLILNRLGTSPTSYYDVELDELGQC